MLRPVHSLDSVKAFDVMEIHQEAKRLERMGRSVIHLEIGEPDFKTPHAVIKRAQDYIATGEVFYTPAAGLPELREEISRWYKRRYKLEVAPERIFITPGASGALLLAFRMLLEAGDELLVTDPGYPCYRNLAEVLNCGAQLIPVEPESGFQLKELQIRQHWNKNTRAVVLTTPGNPTGCLVARSVMQGVGQCCNELGGALIVDETYQGLIYDAENYSALELCPDALVINSFSKFFGMTGWRIGWVVVPESFIRTIEKLAQNVYISAPGPSQHAALAAFEPENLAELERRRVEFKSRRDFLIKALLELGFKISAIPQGGFYLYANSEKFSKDSFTLSKELLERCGVAVTPGRDFGDYAAEKYIRFAYTRSASDLSEAISRLKQFLS